jgi:hypothetical protein
MGGNVSRETVNIQQNIINDITQSNQQNCVAQTQSSQSGNTVIINGSVINGDFTGILQQTNTDATCIMTSSMESSVENLLQNISIQSTSMQTSPFDFLSSDRSYIDYDLKTTIQNQISQINEQGCIASSITSTNNNYVYVGDSTINGNFVGVSSASNANASCTMSNYAKSQAYNSLTTDNVQKSKFTNILAVLIGVALIIFVLIGGVGVVVGLIYFSNKKKPELTDKEKQDQMYDELGAELESGALDAEIETLL